MEALGLSNGIFDLFGCVIDYINPKDKFSKLNYVVTNKGFPILWEYENFIMIEPVEGSGIIKIISKDRHCYDFFLDKTIMINEMVQFSIFAEEGNFSFNLYSDSVRTTIFMDEYFTSQGILPQLKINRIYTFLYQNKSKKFAFNGEKHSFYELTYIDSGTMLCILDGESYHLVQGDILIILPDQEHKMFAANDKGVSFLTLSFDLDFECKEILDRKIIKSDTHLSNILKSLIFELNGKNLYNNDMVLSLLAQVVVMLIRKVSNSPVFKDITSIETYNPKNLLVKRCMEIIVNDLSENLSIDYLAKNLCISTSYLSKLFRNELGCSVKEFIIQRKLEMSKKLITQGQYNITEISQMLGYCSVSFFSTLFKKQYGVTPREFSRSLEKH